MQLEQARRVILFTLLILASVYAPQINAQRLKDLPHKRTGNFQIDSLYFLADRNDSTKMWKGKAIFDSTLMVNRKNKVKKTLEFGDYGVFKLPKRDTTANKSLYLTQSDTLIAFVRDSTKNRKDTLATRQWARDSLIGTTKISYLAKNETFTGVKTLTNGLAFSGLASYLVLPTQLPLNLAGGLAYVTGTLQYFNGSTNKTLATGTGTTNEIPYWSDTNTLGSLSTSTYPSLTELSYVKGVASAIQTQLNGKQTQLNGTGFVKASGTTLSYDNSTYAPLSGNNTWTGTNTFDNIVSFGGSATFHLPTYNAHPIGGTLHYASGLIRYSNGFDLLTLATTANLSSYALINQTMHIGTTALAINRASGVLSLAGVSIDGNAATATKLATARTINGISFDGTADITIPTSVDQAANYTWTGLHKWTSALLSSDTTGAYFNSYTATSGADIKGLTSYVYTSSNPTANKIYGGMFNAVGSGTSGGSQSYGIYANASGSNTSYAGYFTAKGTAGDNYAIYADATSGFFNAYAAYFANGLVYINNGYFNVADNFVVNNTGQLTQIGNVTATSGYVPIGNGTHFEPVNLFDRNNTWTGSITFTPESFSYNTTLDASGKTSISAGGSGNGTTTTISNGVAGQILILINTSSSFTWTLNETGNINLAGSADYVMGQSDTITLIYESGSAKWLETSRSDN